MPVDFGGLLWQAEQVENPFEASFLLLAGIPYIQPFADGNTRSGRLACNVPLLKAGVPPMSFISLDKADYLAGLILFYETGDLSLLAEVVADGYVAAAPSYAAAVAVGRQPRSVQLRERQGNERAIQSLVEAAIANDSNSVDEEVSRRFPNVSAEDKVVSYGKHRWRSQGTERGERSRLGRCARGRSKVRRKADPCGAIETRVQPLSQPLVAGSTSPSEDDRDGHDPDHHHRRLVARSRCRSRLSIIIFGVIGMLIMLRPDMSSFP